MQTFLSKYFNILIIIMRYYMLVWWFANTCLKEIALSAYKYIISKYNLMNSFGDIICEHI